MDSLFDCDSSVRAIRKKFPVRITYREEGIVRVYVNPFRELLFVGVDQVPQGFTTPLFMNYSIK